MKKPILKAPLADPEVALVEVFVPVQVRALLYVQASQDVEVVLEDQLRRGILQALVVLL